MRALTFSLVVVVALGLAGAASAVVGRSAGAAKITPKGVDGVRIGKTFHAVRREGLVGRMHPGCELAPDTHSAKLLAPLKGSVDFSQTTPRTVVDISIRGGARARGVGIGSRARAIRRAYPKAKFDHRNDAIFGTLVNVPKSGGGRLQFLVSTTTHRVTLIGVPFIAFCE
jgi:hypothetical protein